MEEAECLLDNSLPSNSPCWDADVWPKLSNSSPVKGIVKWVNWKLAGVIKTISSIASHIKVNKCWWTYHYYAIHHYNQAYIICPLVQLVLMTPGGNDASLQLMRQIFVLLLHGAVAWPVMQSHTHWSEEKFQSILCFLVVNFPHFGEIQMEVLICCNELFSLNIIMMDSFESSKHRNTLTM